MVTEPNDDETKTVVLKIRVCDNRNCRGKAVVLSGPGEDCPHGVCNGDIAYTTGDVQTAEMTPEQIENVADSEIMEIKD